MLGRCREFSLIFLATFDFAHREVETPRLFPPPTAASPAVIPLFRPFSIYVTKTHCKPHSYGIAHAGLNALLQRIRIIKRNVSRCFRAHRGARAPPPRAENFPTTERKKRKEETKGTTNRKTFGGIASLGIGDPWDAGTRRTKNRKWVNRIGPINRGWFNTGEAEGRFSGRRWDLSAGRRRLIRQK